MTEPEIHTPLEVAIQALEKLERQCRQMSDYHRKNAMEEDERAKLYATVIAFLKRTVQIGGGGS
jgi:hypothetical protein